MDSASSTISDFSNTRVLVVGDLMLDHYVYGEVHRQAPEAPVPVLAATQETYIPGGAAGVVANIAGLQAQARVIGVIGHDGAGHILNTRLKDMGADTRYLITAQDRPTIVKLRFMKGSELLLRTDYEIIKPLSDDDEQALIASLPDAMKECGAVILSDYGKGLLTQNVRAVVIAQAKSKNIPVLVDPKGGDFTIYKGADIITPNAKELHEATHMPTSTQDEVIAAAQFLRASTGIETIIAKRSEHGMSVISSSPALHFPATARDAKGVAGAGDTVIATLAVACAAGLAIDMAANLANEAAGIIVTKPGTTPITKAELNGAVADSTTHQAPIIEDNKAARAQIDAWKAQGLTVGFTNGCFDIIHYGHVHYLNRARARCDRLIVGLNVDASISRLKGEGRPVHTQDSRAAVLAALGCVDMVVLFGQDREEQDMPLRLIEALKPDIGFKGGDYQRESLPEVALIEGYGGRFEIMPAYDGHSTTAAIQRIKKAG